MTYDYTNALRKREWEVHSIPFPLGVRLVKEHHYAKGGSNTAVAMHGLIRRADQAVLGCAWWIPPTKGAAQASTLGDWRTVLALTRLVLTPEAPHNAATFLLMQSVRRLPPQWSCLITYADESQGHTGGIYKAAGWEYIGKTKPEKLYVRKDGTQVARKAGPWARTHDTMIILGFKCLGSFSKHKFRLLR